MDKSTFTKSSIYFNALVCIYFWSQMAMLLVDGLKLRRIKKSKIWNFKKLEKINGFESYAAFKTVFCFTTKNNFHFEKIEISAVKLS